MSELTQMRNRITELERQRENASNSAYLSYCEGLELKAKLEIATKALEYISDNGAIADDVTYCVQAEQALKEIKGE